MLRGLVYSVISAMAFGFLPIFGRLGYDCEMGVFEMLQYRFFFAALMLLVWLLLTRPATLKPGPRTLAKAAVLGLIFYPIQSWCFISAVRTVPAAVPTLILYFYPVMVTLLCAVIYRQPITRSTVLSLVLVTLGCCLVFYEAFLMRLDATGLLLSVAAMVIFSLYLTAVQYALKGENPLPLTFYLILFAGSVHSVLAGGPTTILRLSPHCLGVAAGFGLVCTIIAVIFLYKAVELIGSPYTSIFSTVEPVTAVLASWLILDEPILPVSVVGMVLVIAGIVLPNLHLLRIRPEVQS
ncbi:DMT family transporter [Paucidesulfovibrio longus]|uniref:DMT family transporter n=1 Tax=Paucidesulfovibrio longus TaxID=889 RepID=UPI0003B328D4|nr:DMT family transporter [Paucidesulfovibrio longus]